MNTNRRKAIQTLGVAGAGLALLGGSQLLSACSPSGKKQTENETTDAMSTDLLFFEISLAQWSLNRAIFGASRQLGWEEFGNRLRNDPDSLLQGTINPLDFPLVAKRDYGISAVEYVNTFYFSKAKDMAYWGELKKRCDDQGVKSLLIMCDAEGNLGDLDEAARKQAVENHYKWVDAAKFLGCHSIRVNAAGNGTAEEVKTAAVDGLGRLTEYGESNGINVIVENHGGYSSDGKWLSAVISQVGSSYCGTLPDFGNFCIERGENGCTNEYDRYLGMQELLPFAKGVSAKAHDFDADGNETHTDFGRMLNLVRSSGFKGFVGIEYEGDVLSEPDGIRATKALLEKAGRIS